MVNKIKELNIKQIIFLVLETLFATALVLIATFYKSTGEINIISKPNDTVILSGENSTIIQSYQIPDRIVSGLGLYINLEQSENIGGNIEGALCYDIEGNSVIGRNTVSLLPDKSYYEFSFGDQSIEPGCKYYLRFSYTGGSEASQICIDTNSDYAGLTVNGTDYPGAINASINYRYSGNLAGLLKIMLVFTAITFLIMIISNRDFGSCIAMSFGIALVYLFIFGILGWLNFGVNSLYIICMIITVFIPFLAMLYDTKWSEIISPALFGFWGLFLVYFILDRNLIDGMIDDLNHWQLSVRDMWFSDSYAYHIGNAYRAPRYVPGFATIEYFFVRLYGTYREGILLLAAHTTGFAFLGVMFSNIKWKSFNRIVPVMAAIAIIPIMVIQQHYGILYVDSYLGIIGGYLFITYLTEEYSLFNVIRLTIGSIALILTKDMGLVIAFTVYLAIAIDILIKNKGFKNVFKKTETKAYFISGISSVSFFALWEIYIKVANSRLNAAIAKAAATTNAPTVATVNTEQTISNSVAMIAGDIANGAKHFTPTQSVRDFIRWFIEEDAINSSIAPQSFVITLILIGCVFGLFEIAGVNKKLKINLKTTVIALSFGLILYSLAILACYIMVFNEPNTSIPAAQRYMGSYLIIIIASIIGIIVVRSNAQRFDNWRSDIGLWMVAVLLLSQIPSDHHLYTTEENFGLFYTTWKSHRTISDCVRTFADKGDSIYYISYEDSKVNVYENYITFHNAIVPSLSQGVKGWRPVEDDSSKYKGFLILGNAETLSEKLLSYDYVYLRDYEDYFVENYSQLFDNEGEIIEGGLYKIIKYDEHIKLHKIATKSLK